MSATHSRLAPFLVMATVAVSVSRSPAQEASLAATLQSGSLVQKSDVVASFLRSDPETRSAEAWPLIARELEPLTAEAARRRSLIMAGPSTEAFSEQEGLGAYQMLLVRAVADWRDPSAIPSLVSVIETGNIAINALVSFGDAAVEPVSELALDPQAPVERSSSAIYTLRRLIETGQALSTESRSEMRRVATYHLRSSRHWLLVTHAAELGAATNDAEIRSRIAELVSTPTSLEQRLDAPPDLLVAARTRISRALERGQPK